MSGAKLENYNSVRGAEAYKSDYTTKRHRKWSDSRERQIFERFFAEFGRCESLLDVPCGAGRLFELFRSHAAHVVEGDWSSTMLALNRRDHDAGADGYVRCSGLKLPFAGGEFDVVVSVRLSHHLDELADREAHARELFRVAQRGVVMTWFSATSLKNVLRVVRSPFNRKKPKNVLHDRRVVEIARDSGFERMRLTPLSRVGSGHVFGQFRRRG